MNQLYPQITDVNLLAFYRRTFAKTNFQTVRLLGLVLQ